MVTISKLQALRFLCCGFLVAPCLFAQENEPAKVPNFPAESNRWTLVGILNHSPLKEASGLAASRAHAGVLWTHNDGGAGANVFAIDSVTGAVLTTIPIPEIENLDWEDAMVVSPASGQHFTAIADIGDNEKRRRECSIHLFQESGTRALPSLTLQRTIRFHYPGGKRYDSEATAFDSRSGSILVFTKSKTETLLFSVSLDTKSKLTEASYLATLAKPASYPEANAVTALKRGIFGVSTTAADVSPDGRSLAVLTYTECLLYRRDGDEDWGTAAQRSPKVIALPAVYQAEALCFSADGSQLFITSENTPSPLYRIDIAGGE